MAKFLLIERGTGPKFRHRWRGAQAAPLKDGAIAQLGERLHGMQEVVGSIPSGSTNPLS